MLRQADEFAAGVSGPVTTHRFSVDDGADAHCQANNLRLAAQVVYDWLDDLVPLHLTRPGQVGRRQRSPSRRAHEGHWPQPRRACSSWAAWSCCGRRSLRREAPVARVTATSPAVNW